jgi:hypothetical protein
MTAPPLPLDYAACMGLDRPECEDCLRLALRRYIRSGAAGDGRFSYIAPKWAGACRSRIVPEA